MIVMTGMGRWKGAPLFLGLLPGKAFVDSDIG